VSNSKDIAAPISAPHAFLIERIRHSNLPLAHESEARSRLPRLADHGEVAGHLEVFEARHENAPAADIAQSG
jgi:hypothetical protein